jgi:hypothetical protein
MIAIRFRVPHYRLDNGKFDHFSYCGRGIHGAEFVSPSRTNFTTPRHDERFTGHFDKNGIEIFEGDFVKSKYTGEEISLIKFGFWWQHTDYDYESQNGFYHLIPKHDTDDEYPVDCDHGEGLGLDINGASNYLEIVGNIHQNPELLK